MYRETAKLVLYRHLGEDNILFALADICREFYQGEYDREDLITRIYGQVNRLLEVATRYGFNRNLWHNYLAFLLVMNENPFSLVAEKHGAVEGSVNEFAKNDFGIFKRLFDYNFKPMEDSLGIACFSLLSDYSAVGKKESMYNKSVSEKVQALSEQMEAAGDAQTVYDAVTGFYQAYGVGKYGMNKAFRIAHDAEYGLIAPITTIDTIHLDDLIGYEIQKKKLIDNTEAFVEGRSCNNVLLFGDSGTGKSTAIKAILNEYYDRGLRMIEIYKHQFQDLSAIISEVKNRNYRFIIYMDDLSFEEFEIEYKYLKAVIEGGLEVKPENVLIYATSNRRHLIKENWSDRDDMQNQNGMHHSDTMQEKLSLVARFGVSISYSKPSQKEYFHIVRELAKRNPEITMSDEELIQGANAWELSHGGISGRTARQYIDYVSGMQK